MTPTSWTMVLAESMRQVVLRTLQVSAFVAARASAGPSASFTRSLIDAMFRNRFALDRLLAARRMPLQLGPGRHRELRLLPPAAESLPRG